MKLHSDPQSSQNTITGYGIGFIEVNKTPYSQALIVQPDGEVMVWPVEESPDLTEDHFSLISGLQPELVIIGTGKKQVFLNPKILQPLIKAKIGFEMMDSQAACRTYNILMGEGRKVLAAIILEKN
ncbi:Mth938-like domain-containing protein [Polynucleobacter sp. HIN7]|uniref:Mth938-like domain-containing protein n=1 Tax=Polynucleobacter sp. HIN7 TaxID=3047866 RepID=UPI002573ADBE|nr:Mth938-like domain-containing protein [Polynucleobacter sp. HIN7]BEI36803.1 Mth938-like domain-containing protein [Polynucleobacter sp. HIN7]